MAIIDIQKWLKRAKGLRKILATRSLILMYHRVAEKGIDPWSLTVTPEHFEEHLAILTKHTQPLSLLELAQAHQAGKIPEKAVAITFDDGYANNLHTVKPVLEKYQFPATVFVTTGHTENQREFWWDELDNIIFQPKQFPKELPLEICGKVHHWKLANAVDYSEAAYAQDYDNRPWIAKPDTRMYLYHLIWKALLPLAETERQQALEQIIEWADYQPIPRASHRPMTPEELQKLEMGDLVQVGAHTVNHPYLNAYSIHDQKEEINQSKDYLERILNHPVTTFAYPFGIFNDDTLQIVKEAGFECACSIEEETVWQGSDTFQLPRFNVIDWDGKKFEKQLFNWFTY